MSLSDTPPTSPVPFPHLRWVQWEAVNGRCLEQTLERPSSSSANTAVSASPQLWFSVERRESSPTLLGGWRTPHSPLSSLYVVMWWTGLPPAQSWKRSLASVVDSSLRARGTPRFVPSFAHWRWIPDKFANRLAEERLSPGLLQRLPVSPFPALRSLLFSSGWVAGTHIGSHQSHLNLSRCFSVMLEWNQRFSGFELSPAWSFSSPHSSTGYFIFISRTGRLLRSRTC